MLLRIACFFSFLIPLQSLAQEKVEREYRVKAPEVPAEARDWLDDSFEGRKKVKWFMEETSGKRSYEAKFSWKKEAYSVEFDLSGKIEDIEIQKDWEDLEEEVRINLGSYFDGKYNKWRIEKIQLQYTGDPDDLEDLMDEEEQEDIQLRYEIEYYAEGEEGKNLWEGLFDDKGKLIGRREIIIPPADNLFF
ncbi:hypothetical protein [Cyclobacterium plantarum]|uniref:Beta-lactamase-inhibitor-like PepSY-like domain-containing protein n=1 Tax=Cyclobacterium plantarum TaxID=2716263 RepID=A0ABX0H9F2_9BACT|nr:hypothetical protein [Cyclobacterium plantarum]NHE58257.1 hypothetical protein [Cyclobacterium plantarum]